MEGAADYLVNWKIDIDADSPEEAASKALLVQRDPGSEAVVFHVLDKEKQKEYVVDLEGERETEENYKQYVLLEPRNAEPQIYLLQSSSEITLDKAVEWAEDKMPDIDWEKDAITLVDKPTREYIEA